VGNWVRGHSGRLLIEHVTYGEHGPVEDSRPREMVRNGDVVAGGHILVKIIYCTHIPLARKQPIQKLAVLTSTATSHINRG